MTVAELKRALDVYDDGAEVAVIGQFGGIYPAQTLVMVNYDPRTRTGCIDSVLNIKDGEIAYLYLSASLL